jgi:Lon protease-like protein
VVEALARVTELARRIDPRVADAPALDPDPMRASYEAAALAPIGPLDAQRLLATDTASTRLDLLAGMLYEHGLEIRARFGLDE